MEAFFFLDLHQDNVVSDLADAFPGDHILALSAEKTEKSARPRHDQSCKPSGRAVKFHIYGASKTAAGAGIYHFFLFQLA